MAICASGEKLLQEATDVRRGRSYPVANDFALKITTILKSPLLDLYFAANSFNNF